MPLYKEAYIFLENDEKKKWMVLSEKLSFMSKVLASGPAFNQAALSSAVKLKPSV